VLKASPTGGTFTINGLAMTELKPRDFAVGDKPTVKYDFTDANGCSSSVSKQVEITAAGSFTPIARSFDICPQPVFYVEALTLEEEAIYKQQGITPKYYWNHTQDDFRFIIIRDKSQEGDYEVSVRDQSGCPIAQKSFKVKVNCEPRLFVPTAFTPNNDNQNDYLEIFGEDFIKLDFKVFNRWGEVVFTARSKKEMWDGMLGGKPAPTGVYTWKASYENSIKKGEVFQKQGMFVLIR
jgi:gliding motility-associated-like protein